jgi:two-component system, OmpR family, response regulator
MDNPSTILIVDDDRDIRSLLADYLEANGYRALAAADGTAMWKILDESRPDLIVLDLNLPGDDGLTLCRKLRAHSTMPVIMLTARSEPLDRILGLEMGADDYLPKPFEVGELAARLHAVARRSKLLNAELSCGNLTFLPAEQTASVAGKTLPLRRRETAVLSCLLRSAGRPVSKSFIEDQLYSFGEEVASNSVEVHIHNLRKQLAAAGATVRIETRRGIGYVLSEDRAGCELKPAKSRPK